MIALLDTNKPLDVLGRELGCECEQLLTPLTRFRRTQPDRMFAIDNGAFSGFDCMAFEKLLYREQGNKSLCRWVAAPDVVGSARRTLEVFNMWGPRLKEQGWPVALVAQDGIEDLTIPWWGLNAIFIGGTTRWKLSDAAEHVVKAGIAMGVWVHVGRVNTPGRFELFERLGASSIDGSGLAQYTWMRENIHDRHAHPRLAIGG